MTNKVGHGRDEARLKQNQSVGVKLVYALEQLERHGFIVTSIKIKYPTIDPMVILTARGDGRHLVAFRGGASLHAIMGDLALKAFENEIDWKDDKFKNE